MFCLSVSRDHNKSLVSVSEDFVSSKTCAKISFKRGAGQLQQVTKISENIYRLKNVLSFMILEFYPTTTKACFKPFEYKRTN